MSQPGIEQPSDPHTVTQFDTIAALTSPDTSVIRRLVAPERLEALHHALLAVHPRLDVARFNTTVKFLRPERYGIGLVTSAELRLRARTRERTMHFVARSALGLLPSREQALAVRTQIPQAKWTKLGHTLLVPLDIIEGVRPQDEIDRIHGATAPETSDTPAAVLYLGQVAGTGRWTDEGVQEIVSTTIDHLPVGTPLEFTPPLVYTPNPRRSGPAPEATRPL